MYTWKLPCDRLGILSISSILPQILPQTNQLSDSKLLTSVSWYVGCRASSAAVLLILSDPALALAEHACSAHPSNTLDSCPTAGGDAQEVFGSFFLFWYKIGKEFDGAR